MFIDRWTEIRGNFAVSLGMRTTLQVGQEVIRDRTILLTAAKKMKSSCVCARVCVCFLDLESELKIPKRGGCQRQSQLLLTLSPSHPGPPLAPQQPDPALSSQNFSQPQIQCFSILLSPSPKAPHFRRVTFLLTNAPFYHNLLKCIKP